MRRASHARSLEGRSAGLVFASLCPMKNARGALAVAVALVFAALARGDDDPVPLPRTETEGETWRPRTGLDGPPRAPAPLEGFLDLRGIFHAHSRHSHDSKVPLEKVVAVANALAIDFFFMTDHPSPDSLEKGLRGRHGRTLFFAGAETSGLLALDLREPVRGRSGTDAIAQVVSQGGIALVAHPEEWTEWDAPFSGMEIANLHYSAILAKSGKGEAGKRAIAALAKLREDPEGALLAIVDPAKLYLDRWDDLGKKRRVVGVAGNDAHENVKIGDVQVDPYCRSLRVVDTHLFARGTGERDVREALLAGRGYVAFEVWGDSPGFVFFARDKEKKTVALLGEEVHIESPLELVARAPAGGTIRILRDGAVVSSCEGEELALEVTGGGVYRVLVVLTRRGREVPWIFSNPIYVREAD
ncbi:hypothetical protein HY251_06710 [bacterium]|nr:hypothetical protein [bacterium]